MYFNEMVVSNFFVLFSALTPLDWQQKGHLAYCKTRMSLTAAARCRPMQHHTCNPKEAEAKAEQRHQVSNDPRRENALNYFQKFCMGDVA